MFLSMVVKVYQDVYCSISGRLRYVTKCRTRKEISHMNNGLQSETPNFPASLKTNEQPISCVCVYPYPNAIPKHLIIQFRVGLQ
jgi:hypothetical protein